MHKLPFIIIVITLISVILVAGHGPEEEHALEETPRFEILAWPDPLPFLYTGFAVMICIVILSMIAKFPEWLKVVGYIGICLAVLIPTIYVTAYTVNIHFLSATAGPVHWHADFEIWVCGEKQTLPESEGVLNRIGTAVFHHHNDYRIHVEGVVTNLRDIRLGRFFYVIGGRFTKNELIIPLIGGGTQTWRNRDPCPDGHPGALNLLVNGESNPKMDEYIISPYSTVPPGDKIKIIFD